MRCRRHRVHRPGLQAPSPAACLSCRASPRAAPGARRRSRSVPRLGPLSLVVAADRGVRQGFWI